jgi:hypothetical protein
MSFTGDRNKGRNGASGNSGKPGYRVGWVEGHGAQQSTAATKTADQQKLNARRAVARAMAAQQERQKIRLVSSQAPSTKIPYVIGDSNGESSPFSPGLPPRGAVIRFLFMLVVLLAIAAMALVLMVHRLSH